MRLCYLAVRTFESPMKDGGKGGMGGLIPNCLFSGQVDYRY